MITQREPLPSRRHSWTQKITIGGHTLYMTCGEYDDGRLGEVFLDLGGASTPMRAMLHGLAIAISINLQHGIGLAKIIHSLRNQDFRPQGPVVGSDNVSDAKSIVNYVCKELEAVYLKVNGQHEPPSPPAAKIAGDFEKGSGV